MKSPENWTPPPAPARDAIAGRTARLEPLDERLHGADLWAAFAGEDEGWRFMANGPFATEWAFREWLKAHARDNEEPAFAVIDTASRRAAGLLSYMAIRPASGVAEIGDVIFAPALRRTTAATEAIFLALRRLFDLGYRRVEWKCDARNRASRQAARRSGFEFEGLFRQHMIVKHANRDTAWFAMLDGDWPGRRQAFEAWLAPENFNADGRQLRPLAAFEPPDAPVIDLG